MSLRGKLRRLFVYSASDPALYWSGRAKAPGWHSVMWLNPAYNEAVHADHWSTILRLLPERREAVLDLGCGTGRLSADLALRFQRYVGIDLPAMVLEARRRHPGLQAQFEAVRLQDYAFPESTFDLVLAMGCLAAACQPWELAAVARGMARSVRPGGRILLLEPFHRMPLLARRCRMPAREAVATFGRLGMRLDEWSGLHFVPARLVLTRSWMIRAPRMTRLGYRFGEALRRLTPRLLADYTVLALTRPK